MKINLSDALKAAKSLLGCKLVHESPEGRTSGYIVETEAYTTDDPASHAYRGQTLRNSAMFKEAGTIYVYFTYGMHYCLNIVTGPTGHGQAVLIRALEPLEGIDLMKMRRRAGSVYSLTNGPAKLAQAFGLSHAHNGLNLTSGPIFLRSGFTPQKISVTPRIGISKAVDLQWRFFVADNPFVSRKVL